MFNYSILGLTVISIVLIIYHHVGYPLLLKWLARRSYSTRQHRANHLATEQEKENNILPSIAIVMPAYNEAKWIADKIRNLAALDYPSDKFRVILACDGCTDNTAAIARKTNQERWSQHLSLTIIEYPINQGKVTTINKSMPLIGEPLVALTDVSALISIDALNLASKHFQNPNIGVINSHYTLLAPNVGEKKYWSYQANIKKDEATLGSVLGAHGALYLFRTKLFVPLPQDTINDDFMLPMNIVLQGYRADVDENIVAVEMEPTNANQDFRRRLRIGAGNYQQLCRLISLLNPKHGGTAFTFASGKALRVLMPFFMLIALIGSCYLAINHALFVAIAIGQMTVYFCVGLWLITQRIPQHPIAHSLLYLVAGHTANCFGSLRYLLGLEKGWKK